ncbi:MAG: glycosyltransferase family 61 protein [Roseicyclus sp.]
MTDSGQSSPAARGMPGRLRGAGAVLRPLDAGARQLARGFIRRAVRLGAAPARFGWRHVEPVTLAAAADRCRRVAEARREEHPLPRNVPARADLPDMVHWWGYSFRDVPDRPSGETAMARVRDATIVSYRREDGQFYPAILTRDGTSIDMREIRFRNGHAEALRAAKAAGTEPAEMARAVWILERVHDNHSHWLTAHLPKLLLLRRMGELDNVLLPATLTRTQAASLKLLGLDPDRFPRFDESRPLKVADLTLVQTDRFRPDLLAPVRDALAPRLPRAARSRRIYVSRARARFRRLRNEDEILPMLEARGFERVFLEEMDFEAQVELMRRAEAVVAPHGAGLTNVMFCAEGTHVVEIASPRFPNPNFYAVASAMGQPYYIAQAAEHGEVDPLQRDLSVAPDRLRDILDMIDAGEGAR